MTIEASGATDPGRVRANNEDSYAIFLPPKLIHGLDALLIVADGMGGHQAGEVASGIVIDTFRWRFGSDDSTAPDTDHQDWPRDLEEAVVEANRAVRLAAARDPTKLGMGSTAVAAAIHGDRLDLVNLGDSRAYLVSGAAIYQLSVDHSWVAEQVRAGTLAPAAARRHPQRNMLTRAVGAADLARPDLHTFELLPGDRVVLCSDGLTNLVSDGELAQLVSSEPDLARAVDQLIHRACQRGAPDNVTVVIGAYAE